MIEMEKSEKFQNLLFLLSSVCYCSVKLIIIKKKSSTGSNDRERWGKRQTEQNETIKRRKCKTQRTPLFYNTQTDNANQANGVKIYCVAVRAIWCFDYIL